MTAGKTIGLWQSDFCKDSHDLPLDILSESVYNKEAESKFPMEVA